MTRRTPRFFLFFGLFALFGALPAVLSAQVKTVTLPLTVDYPLLKSLVVHHAFTGPGESAVVLDEGDGCNFIRVSDPVFSEAGGLLRCETRVRIQTGAPFRDTCLMPVEWIGYVVLLVEPRLDPEKDRLTFHTKDSAVYDQHHRPQAVTRIVWDLIKTHIYDYIDGITVDLSLPLEELKSFIAAVSPEGLTDRVESTLESLRFGKMHLTPDAVRIDILADVERVFDFERKEEPAPVSEEELEQVIESWETWDAFLVHMLLSLAEKPLTEADRQTIFETLLDTRYRFSTELNTRTVEKDIVREQFMDAWTRLSPVFRDHLGAESSRFTLGYLAFFTAADALAALDRIGPAFGIEISREGLIRLGRLISREKPILLEYDLRLHPELRQILGLETTLSYNETEGTESFEDTAPLLEKENSGFVPSMPRLNFLAGFFTGTRAWAETRKGIPNAADPADWLPPNEDPEPYIRRVKRLLNHAAAALLKKSPLHRVYHDFYQRLVVSTAWQESCFRQFVVKKGKVTYLISYNNSSVGLMQINRRVWRGIYEIQRLMWNIHYNAAAGCEILEQYLNRYALAKLKRLKRKDLMTEEAVAGLVYAMYNGGPRQFDAYLKRKDRKRYYLSDRLFMEKFRATTKGRVSEVKDCLR